MKPIIYLASKSIHKIEAVKEAFELFYKKKIDIASTMSRSGVNAQPYGLDEIRTGCKNRIQECLKGIGPEAIVVAIENGIVNDGHGYFDVPCVMIYINEKLISLFGSSIPFPDDAVEETRKIGFKEHTVGEYLKKHKIVVDAEDPHISLSGIPRKKILIDALTNLLTLIHSSKVDVFFTKEEKTLI